MTPGEIKSKFRKINLSELIKRLNIFSIENNSLPIKQFVHWNFKPCELSLMINNLCYKTQIVKSKRERNWCSKHVHPSVFLVHASTDECEVISTD